MEFKRFYGTSDFLNINIVNKRNNRINIKDFIGNFESFLYIYS